MARFNDRVVIDAPDTLNRAGGDAYAQEDELALASLLLTSFLNDQYYRSGSATLTELARLVNCVDPLFAAKAAVFARREFDMRSVTHVVAGELAHAVKGAEWAKRLYEAVVVRPDDVTEILAYYGATYGLHPLPNSLKKGLARALEGFDEYQLAKYRASRKAISLVDAVNLCRPRATVPITMLVSGTLPPADTWEVAYTRIGQTTGDPNEQILLKRQTWRRLLSEGRLGYLALLRNLRNILPIADEELVGLVVDTLTNAERIKTSRVLPFRFPVALRCIEDFEMPSVSAALDAAMEIAFDNVPALDGTTLVAVDSSGSMTWVWGGAPIDKALMFATAIVRKSTGDVMLFDDEACLVGVDPAEPFHVIRDRLAARVHGGGTDFTQIFRSANKPYDRVIILSDMQAWIGDPVPTYSWLNRGWTCSHPMPALTRYRERTGADPMIYCFDLSGYGTAQFPAHKVYQLAGFSEKVFDFMARLDGDRDALVHAIEAVEV